MTAMAALITSLGEIVTGVFSWVGEVGSTIVETPILLLGVGFFVVGGAIGIFGRLLGRS